MFFLLFKDSGRQTSVFVEDTGDEYIADMLIAAGGHLGNSALVNSIWFLCSDRHDSFPSLIENIFRRLYRLNSKFTPNGTGF